MPSPLVDSAATPDKVGLSSTGLAGLAGLLPYYDRFQMSDFERVVADLNVDHHTVCGGGTPSAFLLEGPRNTEAGHAVSVTFHKHVSCNREVRTTRWGSLSIYKPFEPHHELAPPLGREIVLGIYQAVAIALTIFNASGTAFCAKSITSS